MWRGCKDVGGSGGSPETVAVVEFAVHQKPLHQVDVFLAGGAGAAQSVALDCPHRFSACLHGLVRLVQAAGDDGHRTGGTGRRHRGRGKMESNGGGEDHIRSQDLRMWIVHSV